MLITRRGGDEGIRDDSEDSKKEKMMNGWERAEFSALGFKN